MMPKLLAGVSIFVMAVSAIFAAGLFAGDSAPAGAIASASVAINVGEPSSLIGGPQIGLLVGAVMLLASFIWHRNQSKAERRRVRSPK